MSLRCDCDYDDCCDWYFYEPSDYSTMPVRGRRARCESCRKLIDPLSVVTEWKRERYDENGDEVWLASKYHCEVCSDLGFSLRELGYCVSLGDNVPEMVAEYAEMARSGKRPND